MSGGSGDGSLVGWDVSDSDGPSPKKRGRPPSLFGCARAFKVLKPLVSPPAPHTQLYQFLRPVGNVYELTMTARFMNPKADQLAAKDVHLQRLVTMALGAKPRFNMPLCAEAAVVAQTNRRRYPEKIVALGAGTFMARRILANAIFGNLLFGIESEMIEPITVIRRDGMDEFSAYARAAKRTEGHTQLNKYGAITTLEHSSSISKKNQLCKIIQGSQEVAFVIQLSFTYIETLTD
jgi:hypothetical protein